MTYAKMKVFIARMRKAEWDMLVANMVTTKDDDKKKVQPGENSLSQDGGQE